MPVEAIPEPDVDYGGVEFKFDLVPGWSARVTNESTEINRPCLIRNLPIADGTSDPEVLLKVMDHPACPVYGETFPTAKAFWQGCILQDIVITSRPSKTSALANFVYRRKTDRGDGSTAGAWSLTYSTQISHIQTWSTAGGAEIIRVWYLLGEPPTTVGIPATDPGPPVRKPGDKSVSVHQMRPFGVLKATALLTGAAWAPIKAAVKGKRGKINSDEWGGDARGTWFFIGPTTRTTDFGRSFAVELEFLEAEDGHFPICVWHNKDGSHPKDAAPESYLSTPAVGGQSQHNGVTKASIYKEFAFSPVFAFTP